MKSKIKLTQFSHGAGCGCKISPKILNEILSSKKSINYPKLLVGNETSDDAAVYDIGNDQVIISTTDFFMPIVDDPFDFGAIASVNAISDIYAMGGTPLMAIAILGWPISKIDASVAAIVLNGAREICKQAGIPLAGGHSIDSPEPIFGLAVTGLANKNELLTNSGAKVDCDIFLTKPLGVGIFTTAQKRNVLDENDFHAVKKSMLSLNHIGQGLGKITGVKAVTDVTGFGLLGHLLEICEASNLSAEISFKEIPLFTGIEKYLEQNTIPGGTIRNFESYADKISILTEKQKVILCDPQTSGGLLIAVEHNSKEFINHLKKNNVIAHKIGQFCKLDSKIIEVK